MAVQPLVGTAMSSVSDRRQRLVVPVVAFSAFMASLMQSLIIPLVPQLPSLLHTSTLAASWMVTATLLAAAVSTVIMGRLADLYGKRLVLIVCMSSLVVGSILGTFATDSGWMILARALQGVAMAIIPVGMSTLHALLTGERLLRGMALVSALLGIGATVGFAVAATLFQFAPWRSLFAGSAVLGIVAIIGLATVLPPIPGGRDGRVDVWGALSMTVGLVALLTGISSGNQWGWTSPATIGCLAGGILVLIGWAWVELRTASPLLDLRLAAVRPVLVTNLATLITGFGMYGSILGISQLLQIPRETGYGLGASLLITGLCIAPGGLFALFTPPLASRLIGQRGARMSMAIGGIIIATGYAVVLVDRATVWPLIAASAITTIGVGFCFAAAPKLIMDNVPREDTGQANGLNSLLRYVGTTSSSAVVAAILSGMTIASGYGAGALPSETAFVTVFAVCCAATLVMVPLILLAGKRERPAPARPTGADE